jgi:hypothetical protein
MTLEAFEISKATTALCNGAFELPLGQRPWYAAAGVAGVFTVAADEGCELFRVWPGRLPPATIRRLGRRVFTRRQLGYTVWLDSGILRDELDLRLGVRPILKPVHTVSLILLDRRKGRSFHVRQGHILNITPVYWKLPAIGLEGGPLTTEAFRTPGKIPVCVGCLVICLNQPLCTD